MNKLINTIQYFDLFGVPIKILTNRKQASHTSFLGGIISFFLATTSLCYFIYIMQSWIKNEIPPNLSTKQQTNGYAEFEWNQALIQFTLEDFVYKTNPFTEKDNIITPLLFTIVGNDISEKPISLFSDYQSDGTRTITLYNGSLILNNQYNPDKEHKDMKQYLLVFATCQKQFMTSSSSCASDETIKDYLSKYHGLIFLTIRLNQLNYINQNLDLFAKQYYTAFLPNQYSYSQVMLKQQKTIIDDGIIFKNQKEYNFLNNYELINQQVDKEFMSNIISFMSNGTYKVDCFSSYLFRIDNISIVEEVVLPKLGQVLAQIGSIVQLVFLLKYLALYYNGAKLEQDLYHDIITMFYPEIKELTQQHNVFQKILFSEQNSHLKVKYKQLLQQAKEKCRLNNIIYEISRIQFILQAQFGAQILTSSHQLGGKILKNDTDEHAEIKESNRFVVKPMESFEFRQHCNSIEPLEILIKQN